MTKQDWHDEATKKWWKLRRADRNKLLQFGAQMRFINKVITEVQRTRQASNPFWSHGSIDFYRALSDWQIPAGSHD